MTRRRVGLPPGSNLAGAVRHAVWRSVFHLVGGFKVTGAAPYEAMVVVANHSSHADTPALVAAFPAPYKPVVVAADDYWFTRPWRRRAVKLAIGAAPVRRTGGGYESLIEAATQVLGTGSSLLVFPEGTRSTDGRLGPFRTGALRIAREFDVPVLPVALVGTFDLLPKGGRLRPGPVEVRIGRAIQPEELTDDMAPVVEQIEALLALGPPRWSESRTYRVLHRAMDGAGGTWGAAAWGFAEAVSWPVTQEMYLVLVGVSNPRRIPRAVAWLAAGSAAGILTTRALTKAGHRPPAPLTTALMRRTAAEHMARGARGVWRQAFNGVPVKVYAAAAGTADVPPVPLAAHALAARGARAAVVGAAVAVAATRRHDLLRRFYGPYLGGAAVAFVVGLRLVLRRWHLKG